MLKAAWLGHWKAPWGLDRGRRWGDPAWALAAIGQAWVLGGTEGRWPRLDQTARRPAGPRVAGQPDQAEPRPDPAWVALLRHGSAGVRAAQRGPKEDELRAWAWEALLDGDGRPWMAAGSVLLDRAQRLRWIAPLGAVAPDGTLHLPPFLEILVPEAIRTLPPGWWEVLLRAQDAEGRLLPEGPLDPALPWPILQAEAGPLALEALPPDLAYHRDAPWLAALPDGRWMVDPRLRAWGRGFGASPAGLAPLAPPGLAGGALPEPSLEDLLQMRMPEEPIPGWAASLDADLKEKRPRPPLPPPSGHPTWDRLRMRWGGEAPEPTPGYPAWDERAHPCADPFHWMARGRQADEACDPEGSLRAFTLAHAHFLRLGATGWAERAAFNAAYLALKWGDLSAHRRWAVLRGLLPQPWRDLEEAQLMQVLLEPDAAFVRIRRLVEAHPDFPPAWGLLADHAADCEQWEVVRGCLDHIRDRSYTRFLEAGIGPLAEPPATLDPEARLSWEAHRLLRGAGSPEAFRAAWEACPTQILRLELGLQVLERQPDLRRADMLLALQAIAERATSPRHHRRLAALWPEAEPAAEPAPRALLEAWLAQRSAPAWIAWEEEGRLHSLGHGEAPPDGALARLAQEGSLAPFAHGRWIWRGHPLLWEGSAVGAVLLAHPPEARPEPPAEALLLAPWVARLRGARAPEPPSPGQLLLTDGSEPMAGVLRELDRVAGSDLPVLILGPTGSGKELAVRELHQRSGRVGPLVAVNCSAFAEGLLESELFGHVKGAFTGADRDRRGAIEAARGGTLFLDEVADLSPRLQSLLLRVLQEREVRRVGSDHAVKVDVRFAAATHRAMDDLTASGAFRRDLLFRLQGAVLDLPPLARRRHEFPFLVPRLLLRAAESARRPAPALAPGLSEALARHPWPGNVRELLHALERAVLRCEGGTLKPGHFPELETAVFQARTWDDATRAFQRRLLLDALRATRFRVADAAEALGFARPALYAAAKRLGVDLVAERAAAGEAAET